MQSLKLFVLIPIPINQTDKIVGALGTQKERENLKGVNFPDAYKIQFDIFSCTVQKFLRGDIFWSFNHEPRDCSCAEIRSLLYYTLDIYFMTLVSFYYLHHYFFLVINTRCLM